MCDKPRFLEMFEYNDYGVGQAEVERWNTPEEAMNACQKGIEIV